MSTDSNRRDFLKVTAAAGAALGLGVPGAARALSPRPAANRAPAGQARTLLILGGTGFIGPYQVRSALAQGLDVTIFNRGSRPGMFEGVEELVGDLAFGRREFFVQVQDIRAQAAADAFEHDVESVAA